MVRKRGKRKRRERSSKKSKRENKKTRNSIKDILVRYLILIVVAFPNLWLFYAVFTPLTVYPIYWLLGLFFEVSLVSGHIILVNQLVPIELIEACIAGAAYYLLLILNLATPDIKLKKRIYMIVIAFAAFLIVNVLRIFLLSLMAISGSSFFDATHRLFWYLISTIFVVAIWFVEIKAFKIKEIPFYSDIKFLYKKSSRSR